MRSLPFTSLLILTVLSPFSLCNAQFDDLSADTCLTDVLELFLEENGALDSLPIELDSVWVEGTCDSATIYYQVVPILTMEFMTVERVDECTIEYSMFNGTDSTINVCELPVFPAQGNPFPFQLSGSPNPFSETITIRYSLGTSGQTDSPAAITIYHSSGKEVYSAAALKPEGTLRWNGKDPTGTPVPAGAYQAVLRSGSHSRTLQLSITR